MISFVDVTSVSFIMFHFGSIGSFRLYSFITLFLYITLQLGPFVSLSDCKLVIVLAFFGFRKFTLMQHTTGKESNPVAGVFCSVELRFWIFVYSCIISLFFLSVSNWDCTCPRTRWVFPAPDCLIVCTSESIFRSARFRVLVRSLRLFRFLLHWH